MINDIEKLKRVMAEMKKEKKPKEIVPESTFVELTEQLLNLQNEHTQMLKTIRSQPISTVDKLLEHMEK